MRAKCTVFSLTQIVLLILTSLSLNYAQTKELNYDQVAKFQPPKLTKALPEVQWFDDNAYLTKKTNDSGNENVFIVDAESGEEELFLDYNTVNKELPEGFKIQDADEHSQDYMNFLFNKDNDLYFYSRGTNQFKRLTETETQENNPTLSPNAKFVAFTREHNLYAVNIESGLEIKLSNDGSDVVYNGFASWVYYEEILGRSSNYKAFWWSPDGQMIAYLRFDDSPVPEFPLFKADGVHGELIMERYPKVDDPPPFVKLGIANVSTGKTIWVDQKEKTDNYMAFPSWTPDGKQLFYQWLNRGQDNLKIYSADPNTGNKKEIYDEKQVSWVDFFDNLYMLNDGSGFIINSDKSGWSHLYYYDLEGKLISQLTSGDWAVTNLNLVDEDNRNVYFEGFGDKSTDRQLYVVDLYGKNLKRLTNKSGTHSCNVSSNGSFFFDSFSDINTPTKMDLYSRDGNQIRSIGNSKTDNFEDYKLATVELFTIPSGDGYDLPAKWYLPPNFDKSKKYPVLFSIYSGPNAPSVDNSFGHFPWISYYLSQNGIIVIFVDHRASGHFGKEGVALMHRNLGKWEMHDLIAAVKYLRTLPYIDSTKIGITGGSYGGYTTCMALTYGADYFQYGIAQSSVIDWRLYDNVYTERYMDKYSENKEGYEFGSVLTHANKYKGKLLITHGTMDDNVHMQNTIQLIDKFTDMNKDFELMLYPNAKHGVGFPKIFHVIRESLQFMFNNLLNKKLELD